MGDENKETLLEIIDLTTEGIGVAKSEGKVYFVTGATVGDVVRVSEDKQKKNICYATVTQRISPSPWRIDSLCPYFEHCSGCSMQDLSYDKELEIKREHITQSLYKATKKEYPVEMQRASLAYGYRNKIELKCSESGELGYYGRKSRQLIGIKECNIAQNEISQIIPKIESTIQEYPNLFKKTSKEKLIKNITIRANEEGFRMIIVTTSTKHSDLPALFKKLKAIEGVLSVHHSVNPIKRDERIGKKVVFVGGDAKLNDRFGAFDILVSPDAFLQVNREMAIQMYEQAFSLLGDLSQKTVLDLYCGAGLTSLFLAKKAKKVIGVEINPRAIEDARINAEKNHIENVEFFAQPAESYILKQMALDGVDTIVVDPPRKGLDTELINQIVASPNTEILYISCDPMTLGRDLQRFIEGGYAVQKVVGFDMFPRTMHVETVVLMSKVEK